MSSKVKLRELYEVQSQYEAFYTGGTVAWTEDAQQFLCQNNGTINLVSLEGNQEPKKFGESTDEEATDELDDAVYTFDIAQASQGTVVVSAHRSGLLKLWDKDTQQVLQTWKSMHVGPITKVVFGLDDQLLASGGADTTVRVWNPSKQLCLGTLRGCQGVVNLIAFHPVAGKKAVLAAGDDMKIHAWNYETRKRTRTFAGHFSKVTGVSFSKNANFMVSSGRDKILILWNYDTQEAIKTVPVYECLEAVIVLPNTMSSFGGVKLKSSHVYAACAGEDGLIKLWEMTKAKIVFKQSNSLVSKSATEAGPAITDLLMNAKTNQMAVISADHNIIVHDCDSFDCVKQLSGFSDEILDLVLFGTNDRFLGLASNSNDFKIYDTTTMNCKLVKGHTDIVLSLAVNSQYILSASKDSAIRLWRFDAEKFDVQCVAIGLKHTNSVGSVSMSKISGKFCASVSQDKCLKVWKIPKDLAVPEKEEDLKRLACTLTELAHDNDINCVCISPNDQLIATGSQDKTAKLWAVSDLSVVGVFRGHRRGIWAVRFSPVDQILLTNAADCSIRLWSLTDMTCLKTFEGHESSVLRVEFLSSGMQLISAGADGLLKLWSIKTSECVQTMDKHESRIWALCVAQDETIFYSGGSDSQLIRWRDVTEEKKEQEMNARKEMLLQEQELNNLVGDKKMLKALRLALNLDRPLMALKIVNEIIKSQEQGLGDMVRKLSTDHKETLLKHSVDWNTNSRNCRAAQLILHLLLQEILEGHFRVSELNKHLEASLPYTDRHFKRLTEYMKDLKFIEYTLQCMQPHAPRAFK